MLAALLASLSLNLPVTDLEGFLARRVLSTGKTRRHAGMTKGFDDYKHVLVIDDSTNSGEAMRTARQALEAAFPEKVFTFCAVYGVGATDTPADLELDIVPTPRMFEWNVMHHNLLARACVDIDGVLCLDPTKDENDDGEAYLKFLRHARPLHTPTRKIGELVTSRLEKYRAETEGWLKGQGIEFESLVMLDLPDAETRRRLAAHAKFKGEHYRASDTWIFIESEKQQAEEIAQISGKPVLWIGGPAMFYPGALSSAGALQKLRHAEGLKKNLRMVLGTRKYEQMRSSFRRWIKRGGIKAA